MNNKILVVVPHEDDEINLAGAFIYLAKQKGKQVICVFVTNGDWVYPACIRIKEALSSLRELGVSEKDVIFLGYPDGGVHAEKSLFMYGRQQVMNVNGHSRTYGSCNKKDFATAEYGEPQDYTWESLLEDLKHIILKYRPDIIIGTDFDNHPDHRMCSIALDITMGRILNQLDNQYFPIYLKGFAYSIAFEGNDDLFSSNHLLSSRINRSALTYPEFDTDNPAFNWDKRIRFPVPTICQTINLGKNIIYKALCSYVSQRIFVRVGRIINGDQVFWQCRTDNLIHQGEVTVSSGNGIYLYDFQTSYTNDISAEKPIFCEYYWSPNPGDRNRWCRCVFNSPKHIEKISFWGNIETENQILSGILYFSNGYSCAVGAFELKGKETCVDIEPQEGIEWVEFHILKTKGNCPGIAEWGIYDCAEQSFPMAHILCNGEFAYRWSIWPGENVPKISAYLHHVAEPVDWYMNGEKMTLAQIQNACKGMKKLAVVRMELKKHPELTNEIYIIKRTWKEKILFDLNQKLAMCKIYLMRLKLEPRHHRMKMKVKRRK